MHQKRKKFIALPGVMTLALAGLIGLQLVLLNHATALKEQTFRQNVNGALNSIVQKIETHETIANVIAITVSDSAGSVEILNWIKQQPADSADGQDSLRAGRKMQFITSILPDSVAKIMARLPGHLKMKMRTLDTLVNDTLRFVEKLTVTAKANLKRLDEKQPAVGYAYRYTTMDSFPSDSAFRAKTHAALTIQGSRKQVLIRRVLDQLESSAGLPLEARIKPAVLDSIVKATLLENGIDMPYIYGIKAHRKQEFALVQPKGMEDRLRESEFRTPLFPFDLLGMQDELIMYFPEQRLYVLKETGLLFVLTVLLMAVIIFGFVYAVRTIFKQRKFAGALTDFINNMTHEFKTPISTISLAAEAMVNPNAKKDDTRLRRYTQIIRDENSRMRQQVEKILQMAVLEKGEYELNLAEIDIHELIENAIENIALQVEQRSGKITCDLRAASGKIIADAVHVANIIHNLLDNANKYTPDNPEITVSTRNNEQGIRILVSDNGIGLRVEDQKRVFEKYFRVSTGNVHDVKGFGLGLSYVRMMVEAHGGTVGVQSELGRGSIFEVFLPYSPDGLQNDNGSSREN